MHHLRLLAAVAGLIVVLAACQGGTASHTAQASLGAGEGEVDLVIWTGYAERGDNDPNYDWVTPFESKTGCKVKTQDGTDSANMVQLMQSRRRTTACPRRATRRSASSPPASSRPSTRP